MTFKEWFNSAPHRAKYSSDHPAYLAAQEAWEAAHEACAKVCDDKAMRCETKAQEAIDAGEHDEVSAIRSTAWQISVCATAIRARGQA